MNEMSAYEMSNKIGSPLGQTKDESLMFAMLEGYTLVTKQKEPLTKVKCSQKDLSKALYKYTVRWLYTYKEHVQTLSHQNICPSRTLEQRPLPRSVTF